MNNFGQKIKKIRNILGISMDELSKSSGVAKSYLSNIESGKNKNVGIQTLDKIAKALSTDICKLLKEPK